MPELVWWKWAVGLFCAFNIGLAKTGMPGLGIMAIPLFVLTVGDARLSAGWLLPILLVADLFAIVYYRRHAAANRLFTLLPSVALGLAAGAYALSYPESVLRPLVGCIMLAILFLFWLGRRRATQLPVDAWWYAGFYGGAAGFSTMVANAAGPVMNVYLLSRRLPREEFVATGAWFFFCVNVSKAPVYAYHGLFSCQSLLFDLALAPAAIAGALLGRHLLNVLPEIWFERIALSLAFLGTILLFLPK
ncbi:MAG: sulfite exporter TauE/SafE family protein [Bryobacteraceae bacterium]|nr:sulfite exporter TauE/SafE family protein [Bryobacteraceae bacterium]